MKDRVKNYNNKIANFVGVIIIAFVLFFIFNRENPPFITVGVIGSTESDKLQVSICNKIHPIGKYEILNIYDSCEGTIFLQDNLGQILSGGIYITGYTKNVIIFQKNSSDYSVVFATG